MFEIITLNDEILVSARNINNYEESLIELIKQKFEYKPLKNYGFCLRILNVKTSEGHIEDGDILFPVIIEILSIQFIQNELCYGTIYKCNKDGLQIKFIETTKKEFIIAFVPGANLLNAKFIGGVWLAQFGKVEFVYAIGEEVRFKIDELCFEEAITPDQIIKGKMNEVGLGGVKWWS